MKKYVVLILLIIMFSLSFSGCGSQKGEVGAVLDYGFPLALGQKAVVFEQGLEIKFLEVIEDSRCPSGTNCQWPGRVSVKIELNNDGESYQMVLIQPGLSSDPSEEYYEDYRLVYQINPYPQAGAQIKKDDYRLLLTISKQ